jgi:transcriptional regulator with XRE-family HTH domain
MSESLGTLLRQKREALGLTLEEVERRTYIRQKFLAGIEADDHSLIPSVAQARGFIRSYAAFLGLDADETLARVGGTRPRPPQPPPGSARVAPESRRPIATRSTPWRRFMRLDVLLSTGLSVIVIGLLGWGAVQLAHFLANETPAAAATGAFVASLARPTPSETAATAEVSEANGKLTSEPLPVTGGVLVTAAPTPLGGVFTSVKLRLEAVHRSYVRVLVDGKEQFAGRLPPGQHLEFEGTQSVAVISGDGAAIRVIYNGVDQGAQGGVGEAVIRVWTLAGMKTPTPSVTPTATATAPPSATPRLTATYTPAPSATPPSGG